MISSKTTNELHKYINPDVILLAKERKDEIERVSYGLENGYKNNIFISFACTDIYHGNGECMCQDILNQENIAEGEINLEVAEKIAHYVSGLIGGKAVHIG